MGELTTWRFGDLGELYDGPHATPERLDDGPYFLNIASLSSGRLDLAKSDHVSDEDFKTWTRRVAPRENDLLFSYETRLGEAALMPPGVEACLGRRMALLRPRTDIVDPRFLLYYYLSPQFQQTIAMHTIHGATVQRIGLNTMPNWTLTLPGKKLQGAVAEVLGALDDKIAANERFGLIIRELMRSEFDLLKIVSEVGQEGNVQLSEIVDLNPQTKLAKIGDTSPFLEMKNLPVTDVTIRTWGERVPKGGSRFLNGDTLLARITPCLENGKTGLVDFLKDGEVGTGSTEYVVMRPRSGVPKALVYCLAVNDEFRAFAMRHMVGTSGRQRVAAADLTNFEITMLGGAGLKRFEQETDLLLARLKATVDESRALTRTRDELLPLLMSGRVTVKGGEGRASDLL